MAGLTEQRFMIMDKVLIAGVSSGLGTQLARLCLEKGSRVFGGYVHLNRDLQDLADAYKDSLHLFEMNVDSEEAVRVAAHRVSEHTDSLDLIINAFGVLNRRNACALSEFDIDGSMDLINVNMLGPLRVAKYFENLLLSGDMKVLVNISSEAGSMATNNQYRDRYDYCMSKAGVNMQSVILQRYWYDQGVKVLAVHPGWMKTRMGGERAVLDPAVSAAGILELAYRYMHQPDREIYFDYNGTPRPW